MRLLYWQSLGCGCFWVCVPCGANLRTCLREDQDRRTVGELNYDLSNEALTMTGAFTLSDHVRMALAEDLGERGDITAAYFLREGDWVEARLVARVAGVLAGMAAAVEVFRQVDGAIELRNRLADGAVMAAGDVIAVVVGPVRSVVTAERTALNYLQHLSGIATLTRRYVEAVAHTSAIILDTRKTLPGWRVLEKAAVRAGGGQNHRFGLFDRAMVKDNHLLACRDMESLQVAIRRLRADHPGVEVELEADNLDQVKQFLGLEGVDYVLLDNMTNEEMREAVVLVGGRLWLEASGGVTLETVAEIAETGVEYISVGALTHSAPALDLALDITES